jgi:Peptidase C39 family
MVANENDKPDSGLASLVLLIRFHGLAVEAEQVRHRLGSIAAVGVTEMLRCAKELQLKARVISTAWQRLDTITLPAIAELSDGGFLVLGRLVDDKVLVQNPLNGRPQLMTRAEFEAVWTGRLVMLTRRASLADFGATVRCLLECPDAQWLIIHGRAVGKPLAPALVLVTRRDGLPEQQPQPGPCDALYWSSVFGALALRSLVACAFRLSEGMQKKFGAVRIARGERPAHCGQSCGSSHSAIGRMFVNGPQSLQRYS